MQYSISELEQLTGVSAHNIRIWERRYGALTPSRTAGNVRYYDDDQLKRLLNIAGLYFAGYKVSKTCTLSNDEMGKLLRDTVNQCQPAEHLYETYISQIVSSALVFDEMAVSKNISDSFQRNGILETYKNVIYPLLVRVGLMWLTESLCPAQEHFLSAIIRQKLFSAIEGLPVNAAPQKPGWLLFLPEDEDHDIGLLLAAYLIRSQGGRVIYLGPKVPLGALHNAAENTKPHSLLFFMTRSRPSPDAKAYLDHLSENFEGHIYVSGNQKVLSEISLPKRTHWLRSLTDFEQIIIAS